MVDEKNETTVQTAKILRRASSALREAAHSVPDGWFEPRDPDLRAALAAKYTKQAVPPGPVANFIAFASPALLLAVADWLDGEAAVTGELEHYRALLDAVISNESGQIGVLRFGLNEDGSPKMTAESTPAALRLAHVILGTES